MARTSDYVKDLAKMAVKAKSSVPVLQRLFEKYDNKQTLNTMCAYGKYQCLLQADDHLEVLDEAERNNPAISEKIESLKRKTMYQVQQEQKKCRKRAKLDEDKIISALEIVPKYICEITIPSEMHRDIEQERMRKGFDGVIRINDIQGVVYTFLEILRDEEADPHDLVLALLFLSGRRMTELLGCGSFRTLPGSDHCCFFEGQIKKQGQEKPYGIPCLARVSEIQACLTKVRTALNLGQVSLGAEGEGERSKLSQKSKILKNHLQPIMSPYTLDDMTAHDLRGLYLQVAFKAQQTNAKIIPLVRTSLGTRGQRVQRVTNSFALVG